MIAAAVPIAVELATAAAAVRLLWRAFRSPPYTP